MRYGARILAGALAMGAGSAQAESIFFLDTKQMKAGDVLPNTTPMPGGGQIGYALTTPLVFQSADWQKYSYKQLIVAGMTEYPLQEIVFQSKAFTIDDYRSILTIFEGEFPSLSTRMDYALSCGNAQLAGFSAQNGKLTISKFQTPDIVWGTYKRANTDAKGKEHLLIHSAFILIDLKKKTFRLTFMEDGETMTTGTRPWNNQAVTLSGGSSCKLEVMFNDPHMYNRYIIANVGISANK